MKTVLSKKDTLGDLRCLSFFKLSKLKGWCYNLSNEDWEKKFNKFEKLSKEKGRSLDTYREKKMALN